MTDFDDLVGALRQEHDGRSSRATATRARVMMSLHERRHRRRVRWGFGVPLAAILVGSTAWAGAQGELGSSAQRALETVRSWFDRSETTPALPKDLPPSPASHGSPIAEPSASDTSAANTDAASTEVLPSSTETNSSPEEVATPQASHRVIATRGTSAAADPPPGAERVAPLRESLAGSAPPADDPHLVHYRGGHEAQFERNDCAAAVSSYDLYLARAPQGPLVPEARFHRAVCLVRLQRPPQAIEALRPFADGAYGSYRQQDAKRLLEVLGQQ